MLGAGSRQPGSARAGLHGAVSYLDGILDLLGIMVRRGPHQPHDEPLELPSQLILQVGNQVLAGKRA